MTIRNSESKRVLAIVGSPRRNRNTEILVDEILSGAEENGVLTQKMILSDLDIALFHRDIKNELKYFERYGISRNSELILGVFLDAYTPRNLRHYKELAFEGGGDL